MGGSKAAPESSDVHAPKLFREGLLLWPSRSDPNPSLFKDRTMCSPKCASAPGNERSEWPQALLAIGTFGINDMKQDPQIAENLDASEDLLDFTAEEVNTLQKELAKLLSRKPKCSTSGSEIAEEEEEEGRANLPLNRFLNCPSSLEVDRTTSLKLDNNGDLSPYTKIILSKVKDALQGNRNAIKKKSLSFLLKKICVCGSGFESPPSFRDPIPEPRIEKVWQILVCFLPRGDLSST
ncbi:protein DEEPER ROOTING 1-like [Musa acuminata AAA Group]|uniref:protein DEEPER ROOTING 1-like n=1 Tax=Musa acuminata AAA Group TaxID=214697 RepID=UPI0031CF89A5